MNMTLSKLKKQSASYLNYLLISSAVNVFSFLGTSFYVLKTKKTIEPLKEGDPEAYEEALSQMLLFAGCGIALALAGIGGAIFFVIKRTKVQQELFKLEDENED